MSNRTQYVITSITLQLVAMLYLYIIDLRIMQPAQLKWTDEFGLFLLIPMLVLTLYGYVLLGLAILDRADENQGQWEAKAVHLSDKHVGLQEIV